MPDADFAVGRAAVLRALLAAPDLFDTAYARARWEAAARANVAAELAGGVGRRRMAQMSHPPSTRGQLARTVS